MDHRAKMLKSNPTDGVGYPKYLIYSKSNDFFYMDCRAKILSNPIQRMGWLIQDILFIQKVMIFFYMDCKAKILSNPIQRMGWFI